MIKDLFSKSVCNRVQIAMNQWKISRPGIRPDFLVVGESMRSMMTIAGVLELAGSRLTYGGYDVLFCDASDTCMFVGRKPD